MKIFTKNMPLSSDVNIEELSKELKGYSGADIETLCREAAMIALRENIRARKVNREHFKKASETIYPTITPEMIKWFEKFGETLKSRIIETSKEDRLFV
ncbi:MAG: hypothetical protein P8Y23_05235 [Candidatus Lokiarchaeota archaeon]